MLCSGPLFVDPHNILLAIHSGPPIYQAAPAVGLDQHCLIVQSSPGSIFPKEKKKKQQSKKQNGYDDGDLGNIKRDLFPVVKKTKQNKK